MPQEFLIDCKKAGVAPLEVAAKGPRGVRYMFLIVSHGIGISLLKSLIRSEIECEIYWNW